MVLAIVREYLRCRKMYSGSSRCIVLLEGQAVEDLQRQDQETYEKLVESNSDILERWCVKENRDAKS